MNKARTLLIIANQPSVNTRRLARAARDGARAVPADTLRVRLCHPFDAGVADVLDADAILLGSTENFGYMSGALKDFFERVYYPCLGKTDALPYALYVRAGQDGTGARRAVESLCSGLRWKPIQPALILRGEYQPEFSQQCRELGALMAAGLDAGII